jgi:hypothetical protein
MCQKTVYYKHPVQNTPYKRAHPTAEPGVAQGSGLEEITQKRKRFASKSQGPPMAGPGVKGGHCSDAYKSLSSKPASHPKRVAKSLILRFGTLFLCIFRGRSCICSERRLQRIVGRSFLSAVDSLKRSLRSSRRIKLFELIRQVLLPGPATLCVVRETGTSGNQATHNDVLFQTAQVVAQTADRRFCKNSRGFLERRRLNKRLRSQ